MSWIYLDNNATTKPLPQVLEAMAEMNDNLWANPSSVHRFGQMVRQKVELARTQVAQLIGVRERELIFTSGGTEGNNLALRGFFGAALRRSRGVDGALPPMLVTTAIEHSAIAQVASELEKDGVEVVKLPIGLDGALDMNAVTSVLEEMAIPTRPVLVSIQWANNETGTIQPVKAIGRWIDAHRKSQRSSITFHIDATQAVGKIPVDAAAAHADMLTLAGHKFHGPKGAGALFVRTGVRILPQNQGGPQERDRRGGTENAPGIVGMGVAATLAQKFLQDEKELARLTAMRDRLENAILKLDPKASVNGQGLGNSDESDDTNASPFDRGRLWNTTNIGFAPLEAEAILLGLSEQSICASAGAACSSGSLEPSPVLLAMGVDEPVAHGSVRFSLSRLTTDEEVDTALQRLPAVLNRLRAAMPG